MICKNCQGEMHLEEYEDQYITEYYYYMCECGTDCGITYYAGGDCNIEWVEE